MKKPKSTPLHNFISAAQRAVIAEGIIGEVGNYFADLTIAIQATVDTMPKIYEQDGMGAQAIVYLHYFKGDMEWYITERDTSAEQLQAFGSANLGYGAELGYISIQELIENGVEIDFHFKPRTLASLGVTS